MSFVCFICAFLTKAACCRNIEIVLHPTILSYIYINIYMYFIICIIFVLYVYIYIYIYSVFVNCPIDSVTQYSSFH